MADSGGTFWAPDFWAADFWAPGFWSTDAVAATTGGGRRRRGRKKRRLVVEIDGQFFDVRTPQEAARLLQQAAELAEETTDVVINKTPKMRVLRASGGESVSTVVREALTRARERISAATRRATQDRQLKQQRAVEASLRRQEADITLAARKRVELLEAQEREDEEAILALLLL